MLLQKQREEAAANYLNEISGTSMQPSALDLLEQHFVQQLVQDSGMCLPIHQLSSGEL